MSFSDSWLLEVLSSWGQRDAIANGERVISYQDLVVSIQKTQRQLEQVGIVEGDRVAIIGDFGVATTSLIFSLIQMRGISVPLTRNAFLRSPELLTISQATWIVEALDDGEKPTVRRNNFQDSSGVHPLLAELKGQGSPGLVLFTSGSTGQPKGVVHDFARLLQKFKKQGKSFRTLNFLLFDHWGGLNTLLHTLLSGGLVVCPGSRNPVDVCRLIERYEVELLPASPSFLNMLLLSGAYTEFDLSSLELVTYGAEPMPEQTLLKLNRELPSVEFRQTYGLIELGVLRAKSAGSDSLLVKVGGEGYDVRVVDGMLEIRAESSMLGYLNAESPFTEDGFFRTGDAVEEHGEFFKILGRKSEQINVGGEKVFPSEVESVLLECKHVEDAVVYGVKHAFLGNVVAADVVTSSRDLSEGEVRKEIRMFCGNRLESFKVPVKIQFVDGPLSGDRQKRVRYGRD